MRKDEVLSSIPWLNKKLLKFELTPYLRRMLAQAELNWSAGRLLMMTAAAFVLPAYAALPVLRIHSCVARGRVGVGRRAVRLCAV